MRHLLYFRFIYSLTHNTEENESIDTRFCKPVYDEICSNFSVINKPQREFVKVGVSDW